MATRYGYDKAIGLTGPLSVNWTEVTDQTMKYLNDIQEKKDTTRKELAQEGRDIANALAKNPFDYTSKYYGFWGKASNLVMDGMNKINSELESGNITKTERDIKAANLKGQVEQFIAASAGFAQNESERIKQCGPNGTYGAEDCYENQLLSQALNYENIEIMFDPDSYNFSALVPDEFGVKRIVSGNQLFNSYNRQPLGKFDMNQAIKQQFDSIGVKSIEKDDGTVVAGNFVTKQGEDADVALKNLAQAMIQQPSDLRNMLSTYPITIEEDGESKTYNFDRALIPLEAYDIGGNVNMEELKKLQEENPTIFYRDIQGNYYESDKAKEVGLKYAMERLTLAADYEERAPKAEKPKDKTRETIDIINAVRLAGGVVSPKLFTQLLKDVGLDDEQIAATFPEGIDDKVFVEFNEDLTSFVQGITLDQIVKAVKDKQPMSLNNELNKLRQIGVSANYEKATGADKKIARNNNQPEPQGFITINALGGKAADDFKIPITEGMGLTTLINQIVNQIPVYQSPEDILFRLQLIQAGNAASEVEAIGDKIIFNSGN